MEIIEIKKIILKNRQNERFRIKKKIQRTINNETKRKRLINPKICTRNIKIGYIFLKQIDMFLDEKLENIYNTVDDRNERAKQLADCCIKSIPNPENAENMSWEDIISTIKRIDNSWHLFHKKHPDLKENWFRNFIKKVAPKELTMSLGWPLE